MLVDCNLTQKSGGKKMTEFINRFVVDLKLVLKEAEILGLVNIDTVNPKYQRKSRLLQFFYSNLMKDAKSLILFKNDSDPEVL
jgi:hypothetical protein